MRTIMIAVSVAAGMAFAGQVFAQATGGGGAAGGTTGAAGTGTGTSSPSSTAVPVHPQAPVTGQTNPGTTPSAPGPSTAKTPPGISPTVREPGYASSHRQPRANHVPQSDTSSADAIQELNEALKRKLSICRGC